MTEGTAPPRPASYDKKVGLVLQGGGALGSYQAGVYEALAASDYMPDWVAGISIGAVNAAIIAGNAPKDRVDRLEAEVIIDALRTAGWSLSEAARHLEMPLRTLQHKVKAFGIKKPGPGARGAGEP